MAHVILCGNEKGGSGKTTTAMHIAITLMSLGFYTVTIDLDTRQQSFSRYIENRKQTARNENIQLLIPQHFNFNEFVKSSDNFHYKDFCNQKKIDTVSYSELNVSKNYLDNIDVNEDNNAIAQFISLISRYNDHHFIVIDTPGSNTKLSRIAHSYANTIITPVNDSFIDVDLIGRISPDRFDVVSPGVYSAMLFEQKLQRAARNKGEINWFVVRNRLSSLEAINKKNVELAIIRLSKRLGFKILPGFCDRVIFKELFLNGLTLHDANLSSKVRITPSVIAARQELRVFISSLQLANITEAMTTNRL